MQYVLWKAPKLPYNMMLPLPYSAAGMVFSDLLCFSSKSENGQYVQKLSPECNRGNPAFYIAFGKIALFFCLSSFPARVGNELVLL